MLYFLQCHTPLYTFPMDFRYTILKNHCTLASTKMFSLMFVFFFSRLKPTTLIKAQNVS